MDNFGTAINCIDGRVQVPVADWLKLHSQVQYVDMITEPGVDRVLAEGDSNRIAYIAEKLQVSIQAHQSKTLAIVGHFDCAANNVSFEEHKEQIEKSVDLINSWNLGIRIFGLYVNEWNAIDLICDTDAEFADIKSFL